MVELVLFILGGSFLGARCSLEVTVTSLHPPRLCRIAVISITPTFLSLRLRLRDLVVVVGDHDG